MVSTAKVSQYLQGIGFPATKEQILDYAANNNAPDDVIDMLAQIPEGTYYSLAGVWDSIGRAA